MAKTSVANTYSGSNGYQLPPAHRAAILAGSDSAKRTRKIEQQRQEFIRRNGDDGTALSSTAKGGN